jgi:hypothetical protein
MSDPAPAPLPAIPDNENTRSDAAYLNVMALLKQHVGDSDALFDLRRAVIEYGKQEALQAIDNVTAALRRPLGTPAGRG